MADLPPYPDSTGGTGDEAADDAGVGPDRGSTTGTPRWVKVFGIIAIVLALLVAIMLLTGIGGEHGPGRHTRSTGGPGGQTAPSSTQSGHARPVAGHTS